ncbi:MAG TPA: glutamine-synthetase adenylyltransferase, partial [Luteimonas sp.]|nr:glutamine-synthetase adenylyltransferase [Luteimonas sp.]
MPAGTLSDPALRVKLERVAVASDFAIGVLARQPELLARLAEDDGAQPLPPPVLDAGNRGDWPALLRRHRAAGSARLVWRDVLGLDDVDATLAGSTA